LSAALIKRSGVALYAQVEEDLERSIASGKYRVGEQLPSEDDLQRMFGVSKFTVREALRRLEEGGLVQKRHGVGSCIIAKNREQRTSFAIEDIDDFLRIAYRAPLTKLSVEQREFSLREARVRGLNDGVPYSVITGVRRLPGSSSVTAYAKVYVPQKYSEVIPYVGRNAHLVSGLIEERLGISTMSIRQEISAPVLNKEMRRQFGKSDVSSALNRGLLFRRWHLDRDDELIICSENQFLDPDFSFNFLLVRKVSRAG